MRRFAVWLDTLTMKRRLAGMLALFALVHIWLYGRGVHFDAGTLPLFAQYLDPALLKHRLLESLLALHMQPPLFNLYLGLVLKLAPGYEALAFQATFLLAGFCLYLAAFRLMRRLGVSRIGALAVSAAFLVSPAFLLYENWLFYTFPEAVLVGLIGLLFAEALATRNGWAVAGFFGAMTALCGIRSLFHLGYFLLAAGFLIAAFPPKERRRVLLLGLAPLLLVFGFYLKNQLLFGKFAASTWLGMNFANVTLKNVPEPERRRLVAEGVLSPVALIPPFSEVSAYPPALQAIPPGIHAPALTQPVKPSGTPNYNHFAYLAISEQYLRDDLLVVRNAPAAFWKGMGRGWVLYFEPATNYYLLPNREKLGAWLWFCDTLAYGRLPFAYAFGRAPYVGLLLGLPFLVVYALWLARRGADLSRAQRFTLLFLAANILYVALLGNLMEMGENNRFRFATDSLSAALVGLWLHRAGLWLSSHFLPRASQPVGEAFRV
jgi:hypothetical protein